VVTPAAPARWSMRRRTRGARAAIRPFSTRPARRGRWLARREAGHGWDAQPLRARDHRG
jgi:hypothetical protein